MTRCSPDDPGHVERRENMSRIVKLEAQNFMRLRAIRIEPDGSLFVVSGQNEQGKTSVLKAIEALLGGKGRVPRKPVREGAKKSVIVGDLGDMVVKRTFTKDGGTTLTVTDKVRGKQSSPQKILDKLVGELSFDPLEFSRMKSQDQAETVQQFAGIDFTPLEIQRQKHYDDRTEVNRRVRDLKALVPEDDFDDDLPDEEVSVAELTEELQTAHEQNMANERERSAAKQKRQSADEARTSASETQEEIERLQAKLTEQRERAESIDEAAIAAQRSVLKLQDVETDDLRTRIAEAEELNEKVREKLGGREVEAKLAKTEEESEALTEKIEELDERKRQTIADAELPIEGLGFDDEGITLDGIPFEQASQAQQLRTSVAMGLALNPKLRVLLIRDGSLLDEKSLRILAEMAEKADAQVWLERVSEDGESTGVVIEDGEVKERKP